MNLVQLSNQLLRFLSTKTKLEKYFKYIKDAAPKEVVTILKAYDTYFDKYPEHVEIDWDTFTNYFMYLNEHSVSESDMQLYLLGIQKVAVTELDENTTSQLVAKFKEALLIDDINYILETTKDIKEIHDKITTHEKSKVDTSGKFLDFDIDVIFEVMDRTNGLQWHTPQIGQLAQNLVKGDFVLLCAEQNKGKGTLLIQNVWYMASQFKNDEQVLWLNSEGNSNKLWWRMLQSVYEMDYTTLVNRKQEVAQAFREFYKRDPKDVFKIINMQDMDKIDVESYVKDNNVGLVVLDMLSHLKGKWASHGATVDMVPQAKAQWCLELANHCPVIGTWQIKPGEEGYNPELPPLHCLEGTKNALQTKPSSLIFMGHSPEKGDSYRSIFAPRLKNNPELQFNYSNSYRNKYEFYIDTNTAQIKDTPSGM